MSQIGEPIPIQIRAEYNNPFKSDSPYPRDIKIGTTIVMPKIERRAPRIFRSGFILMSRTISSAY